MDNNVELFFTNKFFRIPYYQRDYAWDKANVDDLFEDILESIETNTNHFIGTFILAARPENTYFHVVDGQQRLTTLVMLLNSVIHKLDNEKEQIINMDKFIRSEIGPEPIWKLELLNDNNRFFHSMLLGESPQHLTRSQQLLKEAYDQIHLRLSELPVDLKTFLAAIRRLEVMEFSENNDGKAIRMFQTVNDRGKPLTNMEKAKSLLIYYSNRFLSGELDEFVNNHFGEIFHIYAEIKTLGVENQIDVISSKRFTEDSVMRYHYLAYAEDLYDYDAPESYVLDTYLKKSLKPLRNNQTELRKFLQGYVTDLTNFFTNLLKLVSRVKTDPKYFKLFSILGISATLYPLIIRLEMRDLLDKSLINNKQKIIDLIEAIDFRVYKVRGTNPRVDMSWLARETKRKSPTGIEENLVSFGQRFMSDDDFDRNLKSVLHNTPTTHLSVEYSESLLGRPYDLKELRLIKSKQPTVEHIFPQQERFDFPNLGFKDLDEYKHYVQSIGNLIALEKSLNSQCQNKTPDQKISGGYYEQSLFEDPRRISAQVKNLGVAFTREDIQKRTKTIVNFCSKRWTI